MLCLITLATRVFISTKHFGSVLGYAGNQDLSKARCK